MNKRLIFLFSIIFSTILFPLIVFAGDKNEDVSEEELKQKIICTYDKIQLAGDDRDGERTLKLIIELWEDNDGKLALKRKPYYNGNYNDVGNSTHLHYFTLLKDEDDANDVEIGFQAMDPQKFKEQFDALGHCPYIYSKLSNSHLADISTTTSKAYHGMEGMRVSEGITVVQTHEDDKVVEETPVGPQTTHVCEYAIYNDYFKKDLYVKFYMKDNGKKYWSASFLENIEGENEEELTNNSSGVLVVYYSGQGLIDGGYEAPQQVAITIDTKHIKKIFTQDSNQLSNHTFNCLTPSDIGLINEGSDVFYISTDKKELEQDNAIKFESLYFEMPDISLTPDALDCVGILGRPDDNISKPPAFYLQTAFTVMKYVAIVILIVFTIMDYASAVAAQDDDAIKKATSKLVTRLIICIILFVLPTLIEFLFKILDIYGDVEHCKIN